MIKKIFTFLSFMFFIPFVVNAEELKMNWQKNFGGSDSDYYYSVLALDKNEYVAIGRTISDDIEGLQNNGDSDAIIVKYDGFGNIIWKKSWGGSGYDYFYSIIQTNEGDFVVAGGSFSNDINGLDNNGSKDAIVVKFNSNGDLIWQKSFGGMNDDDFDSIALTNDNCYVAVGRFLSVDIDGLINNGFDESLIVKLDADGKIVWKKSWGGSGTDKFNNIFISDNNELIVCGESDSIDIDGLINNGGVDALLVKYDTNGNLIWQKSFGGSGTEFFNSLISINNDFIIVVGQSDSTDISGITNNGLEDSIVVKYDMNGNLIWKKNFGGNKKDYYSSVYPINDTNFIVVGGFRSSNIENVINNGGEDAIIIKYSSDGEVLWLNNWGGNKTDTIKSICNTSDGLIIAGYSNSTIISGIVNNGIDAIIVNYLVDFNLNIKEDFIYGNYSVIQHGLKGIVTAIPNEGYQVDEIIVKDKDGNILDVEITKLEDGTYSFDLYTDVSVEVYFVKDFSINLVNPKNGDVEVDKIDADHGIVIFTPHSGFEFDKVIVKNSKGELVDVIKQDDGTYSFSLVDDVSVEVLFKEEVVNPKTGVIDIISTLFVGFVISFIGYTLVKKNCYRYDL